MAEAPVGMISVDEFSELKSMTRSKIISMIRDGTYVGRKIENEWFIDSAEINRGSTSNSDSTVRMQSNGTSNEIVVMDIRMPFLSMVIFMIKFVIAAIPATIIFVLLGFVFTTVLNVSIGIIIG
jgi:hypothetical protein